MLVRLGSQGITVAQIQELLKAHGAKLAIDGVFGKKTQAAVKKFQAAHGLKTDAIVGPKTYSVLTDDPQKADNYEDGGLEVERAGIKESKGSRYTWLLDNGHGGMIAGAYQTAGKRSPDVPPGIYEGEFNRDIVKRLGGLCQRDGIDCIDLVPERINVGLGERVRRANGFQRKRGNCIFISIHANAFGSGWNSAQGAAVFCPKGRAERVEESKKLAQSLQSSIIEHTGFVDRGVKQASFSVLRKTKMPAILSENGFMTNLDEARKLASDEWRNKIAAAHFEMIKKIGR